MKSYSYKLIFSPYDNLIYAPNKKKAMRQIKKLWKEYNLHKVLQYLF